MELTKDQKKLAAYLLRLASDRFSNHCCNDLDLRKIGLESMAAELYDYLEKDEEEENNTNVPLITYDWLAMCYLADKLDQDGE